MANIRKAFDVYISHSPGDAELAKEIANTCRVNGLEVITDAELATDEEASDALWEALAESRGVLFILSQPDCTSSMTFALGAARSWNKPIFGLVTDPSAPVPSGLTEIRLYTIGQIEDVIRAIKLSGQELSEDDHVLLASLYSDIGVPVDQLALDPKGLASLVKRFDTRARKAVSGERLLSELLRMRKQGKLTKNQAKDRSRSRKGSN